MKFPITVLNDLAKKLRSREVSARNPELTAYTNALIHQNHAGDNPLVSSDFTQEQFALLAGEGDFEYYFPLPYARTHVCEPSNSLQFNDLPPIVLGPFADFFGLGGYTGPRWSIVAQGDDGKYYLLASEDEHAFEPGVLIREATTPNADVRVGHAHIYGAHVVYEVKNWNAAALILGDNQNPGVEITRHRAPLAMMGMDLSDAGGDDTADAAGTGDDRDYAPREECERIANIDFTKLFSVGQSGNAKLLPFTISGETSWQDFVQYCEQNLLNHWDFTLKLPFPEDDGDAADFGVKANGSFTSAETKRDQPLILETLHDIERTFVADEVFEALNLKIDAATPPISVAGIIGRLMTIEDETVEVHLNEDEMQAQAKVMKVLNVEAIVKEVIALPKSKRTPKNIKAIAVNYA
ncbi:hypothetical protein STRATTON_222 [Erwinia phage vB_EamM_Stratton]|uniref:Uncharacterized protein n=1 Tax=Erwinia phage vB_EamM_Stratton TaxID=1883378 RepID=A0A1B2IHA2_9CAUD|nr:hypothetical protein STRATTON_222 [Erwinia phage vB_EamM_Stratton]